MPDTVDGICEELKKLLRFRWFGMQELFVMDEKTRGQRNTPAWFGW